MSTAAPRSCLKPPPRNPWVAEDGGESSTSSSHHHQQQQQQTNHQQQNHQQQQQQQQQQSQQQQQQQQQQQVAQSEAQRVHDVLAHQYATPYQSVGHAVPHPALSVAHTGHSSAHSVSGHPVVSVARSGHSAHGVVHSHTAHSLHAHAHTRPLPNAAHSVHSVPGSLQQPPWVDPQLLWSTPALPGVGGVPAGVFTVGGGGGSGGGDGSCPVLPPGMYGQTHALHPMHHLPQGGGSSGQTSTTGAGWSHPPPGAPPQNSGVTGWSVGVRAAGGVEGSRCEMCHYYCFRAAQAVFVAGIVTGFSLLVAGGVFHRQHVAHLQVLVYIGAMVSLVCVVLLVIFCAMNKDHRTRRGGPLRFSGPQVVVGDPEAVPLRAIDAINPVVVPSEASHGGRTAESGSSMDMLHQSNHSSCLVGPPTTHGCLVAQGSQPVCCGGAGGHPAGSGMVGTVNHGVPNSSDSTHHVPQARHPTQRIEDDYEASQRYNRIWKQPNKSSSEAASKL